MTKRKILVTGGAGYIGSHTVVKLIEAGFDTVIIDNLSNATERSLSGIEKITGVVPTFYNIDLRNVDDLDAVLNKEKNCEAVIQFAALKAVGESLYQPLEYYDNNVNGLIQLLKGCKKYRIPNLIFSSSATVYGMPDTLPVTESHPLKPALSPYANTKRICEEILEDAVGAIEFMKGIALRYFNPIGAHPSGLIGEMPQGVPNNLMPYLTQVAAGIREELMVYGDDYDTADGTAIRDYIHVEDLADAHVRAVDRLLSNMADEDYEVFNLGTGNGFSVKQVIAAFEKSTGVKVPHRVVGRREGDAPVVYSATHKANEVLGWKATRTIEEMTASAWQWGVQLSQRAELKVQLYIAVHNHTSPRPN